MLPLEKLINAKRAAMRRYKKLKCVKCEAIRSSENLRKAKMPSNVSIGKMNTFKMRSNAPVRIIEEC